MLPKNGLFRSAPPLPEWLDSIYPFNRHLFTGCEHTLHFIDEGSGPPILLLHGNPTWSFLWRKIIPQLVNSGYRVIAPDLFGLGLSEKPNYKSAHTLIRHANHIGALIRHLDLQNLTIVGQDWGGPIVGLAAAMNPQRIHGAVFSNTAIRAIRKKPRITPFHRLSHWPVLGTLAFRHLNLSVLGMGFAQGKTSPMDAVTRKAYRFPLKAYQDRTAPQALAQMVPIDLEHPSIPHLETVQAWAESFKGPVKLVWGTQDPILGASMHSTQKLFPNAQAIETDAGHFLQEQVPNVLADNILKVSSTIKKKAYAY
ncbi:MAG: haloalkane dehalogenase [Gammaproteobacteria bacterium]|nr:MAG: haloalkane dehalogenase [Gammaproteobacteria bacterium]